MTFTRLDVALRSEFKYANPQGFPNKELEAYRVAVKAIRKEGAVLGGPRRAWKRALRRIRERTHDCVVTSSNALELQVYTWLDALPLPMYHTKYVSAIKRLRRTMTTAAKRRLCSMEYKFRKDLVRIWAASPRNLWFNKLLARGKALTSAADAPMDAVEFQAPLALEDAVIAPLPVVDTSRWQFCKTALYVPPDFATFYRRISKDKTYWLLRECADVPATPVGVRLLTEYVGAMRHTEAYDARPLLYALVTDVAALDRVRSLFKAEPGNKWRVVVLNYTLATQSVSDAVYEFDEEEHVLYSLHTLPDFLERWDGPPFDLVCVQDVLPVSAMVAHLHNGSAVIMSTPSVTADTLCEFAAAAQQKQLVLHSGAYLPLEHETHCAFSLCALS